MDRTERLRDYALKAMVALIRGRTAAICPGDQAARIWSIVAWEVADEMMKQEELRLPSGASVGPGGLAKNDEPTVR